MFGNNEMGATEGEHTAPGLIECPIPPAPTSTDGILATGPTSLHIVSAVGFSSNRLQFEYYIAPTLLSVVPSFGSTDGGTRVILTGLGFGDYGGIACSFGGVEDLGKVLSATKLECTSPATVEVGWKAGGTRTVPLLVTVNGLHYGNDTGTHSEDITFEYTNVPVVSFTVPATGPPSGTRRYLRVHGAYFRDSFDLACRFGAQVTVGKFVSPSEVNCRIPPLSSTTGDMPTVSVTVNGVDFSREGPPSATFTYIPNPNLLGLSPPLGPNTGGTEVTVLGSGFGRGEKSIHQSSVICRFQVDQAFVKLSGIENELNSPLFWDVSAVVKSDSAVLCIAPAVSAAVVSGSGYATVRISSDGGSSFSTSAPRFLFHLETMVTSVTPSIIPASEGATIVIAGTGFLPGQGLLMCIFEEANSKGQEEKSNRLVFKTIAVWLSPKLVECILFPLEVDAGTSLALTVRVSNNGVDASISAGHLLAYASPELSSLNPAAGPSTGGTTVRLAVDGWGLPTFGRILFASRCRWGTALSTPGKISMSVTAGRVIIDCTSPSAANLSTSQEAMVSLEIDGRSISSTSGLPFTYYNEPIVMNASPPAGRELGGTDVVLTGSGFAFGAPGEAGSGKTVCLFRDASVSAVVVSDSELRCRSPPLSGTNITATGMSVDVRISLNSGVDFGPPSVNFHYLPITRAIGEYME